MSLDTNPIHNETPALQPRDGELPNTAQPQATIAARVDQGKSLQRDDFQALLDTSKAIVQFMADRSGITYAQAHKQYATEAMGSAMKFHYAKAATPVNREVDTAEDAMKVGTGSWPISAGQLSTMGFELLKLSASLQQEKPDQKVTLQVLPPNCFVAEGGGRNSSMVLALVREDESCEHGWMLDPAAIHEPAPAHTVAMLVAMSVMKERDRQISVEGFSTRHDQTYLHGELARAGAAYMLSAVDPQGTVPACWPWGSQEFKPSTIERDLERATALGLAALELVASKKLNIATAERSYETR